jgi:hypothetical protein
MTIPPPARPQKYRPRVLWFFVGGGLLVLAAASFIAGLLLALLPLADEDAVFPADGRPHQVSLAAGEERGIFLSDPTAGCTATDAAGEPVEIERPGGEFTTGEWEAIGRFETGDGDLTFTCTSSTPGAEARIGGLPSVGGLVGGLVLAILGPIVLGIAGLAVLIVTIVLFATRPARPR